MPGIAVHVTLTTRWCVEEGLAPPDATTVARADVEVDMLWPGSRRWGRHFNPTAGLVFGPLELRRAVGAARAGDHALALVHLGRALHSYQDAIGHGRFGQNHLLLRLGLRRDPDVWETMPDAVRTRIERSTRRAIRRFLAATR